MRNDVDYADVQGVVRFGYRKMTEARYSLVRVRDAAAARAWLRAAPITSAVTMNPPPRAALQVALTAAGLAALDVPEATRAGFSSEFLAGMAVESRARRLGDVGHNAPSTWAWGGDAASTPHLVVMFFSEPDEGGLAAFMAQVKGVGWNDAFDVIRELRTSDLDGVEPFGFADGISQPTLDWKQRREPPANQVDYENIAALGEFLLGYRNEYGKYTDRPLLDADGTTASLLAAEDAPDKRDLGRNGTYLVMRQLEQDVRTFWKTVAEHGGSDETARETFAAALVGRTRSGEPLVPVQRDAIPGVGPDADQIRLNQFTFDGDAAGTSCPFGAHVRRANPRNADLPGHPTGLARLVAMTGLGRREFREDLMSSVRFHRILRRGREYGPGLSPADAMLPEPANDPERGLHFLCLNANISRQFEFLQSAWMMSSKFSGLTGESDPILGDRLPTPGCPVTADFTMPGDGVPCRRITGLPPFVTVRGGAYFFLPGLRALRYLAGTRGD